MSQVSTPSEERRILRLEDVEAKTGFKRSHIYALMKKGEFPKACRLGIRAVGWNSQEVNEWVEARLQSQI
ncbi:AlpA family transcriptional regulator [Pseudomonas chlororaphis]|uniref:AlpA family transcriptional regulator n=1 Tax=Pseudomonas chlororaphis TaxID=587753 RepID=UPI00046F5A8B|nr:AlpA family transcriptional regulator [Pseudomonas chlororaphis]